MPDLPHLRALVSMLLGALLALAAWPAVAAPAHEHGVARLDIAVEPARLTLHLQLPLDSLIGFERAPRTDAERAAAQAALTQLRDVAAQVRIDGKAGCTPGAVQLTSAALGLGAGGGAAAADGHAELEAAYEFRCTAGAKAGYVELGLFEAFARLQRIELQVATPRGQMKATLRRPNGRVALAR